MNEKFYDVETIWWQKIYIFCAKKSEWEQLTESFAIQWLSMSFEIALCVLFSLWSLFNGGIESASELAELLIIIFTWAIGK